MPLRQRAKIKCGLPDVAKPWRVCGFHGVNLRRHHQQVHQKKQSLKMADLRVAGSSFAPGEAHAHWCPGSQDTMDSQKFCLKWDGFQGSVTSLFDSLRRDSELVDITLCCEGRQVRAHRMMLSACSPYFRELFKNIPCQQMAIFLKDTSAADLTAVVEFMYKGRVNVEQSQLASFIKTAEMLQLQGLSGRDYKEPPPSPEPHPERALRWSSHQPPPPTPPQAQPQPPPPPPPAAVPDSGGDSPAEPRPKRRRAESAGSLAPVQEASHEPADNGEQLQPILKLEKCEVNLTLDDTSGEPDTGEDLAAALGHVANAEGLDPGSEHSLGAESRMVAGEQSGNEDALAVATDNLEMQIEVKEETAGTASSSSSSDGGAMLQCDLCEYASLSQDQLDKHVKQRHDYIGRDGRHRCEWCPYSSNSSAELASHHLTHAEERPHSCDECCKTFTQVADLTRHRHKSQRPYSCDVCGKAFTQRTHLTVHGRLHSGEKVRQCEECGASFEQASDYTKHMRSHSEVKAHRCQVCPARFVRRDTLITHMRTHTGERPYGCSFCPARFTVQSNLKSHITALHTRDYRHRCGRCRKGFVELRNLKKHVDKCSVTE